MESGRKDSHFPGCQAVHKGRLPGIIQALRVGWESGIVSGGWWGLIFGVGKERKVGRGPTEGREKRAKEVVGVVPPWGKKKNTH